MNGIGIFRFDENCQVTENTAVIDVAGLLAQIGAFMQTAAQEHGVVKVTELEAAGDTATWVSLPEEGGEFHLSATVQGDQIQSLTIE